MICHELAARSSTSLRLRPWLRMKKLSSSSLFLEGALDDSEVVGIGEEGTAALSTGRGRGRGRGGISDLKRVTPCAREGAVLQVVAETRKNVVNQVYKGLGNVIQIETINQCINDKRNMRTSRV